MSNAVVTKQGTPSAPGTVVDTDAAKVVPTSSEVRTEAANREVAEQKKESQRVIGALAKGMTHPARAKDEAVKAVTGKGKGSTKAKPAAAKRGAVERLSETWPDSKGVDIKVGDTVKGPGVQGLAKGRWSRRSKEGVVIPMIAIDATVDTSTGDIIAEAKKAKRKAVHFPAPTLTRTKGKA